MPEFLSHLVLKAQHELDLERLIIFGSRERGDHTPTSDYDLCFVLRSAEGWSKFFIDVKDTAATLCSLDLVNDNEIDAELRQEIDRTGVTLYDCKKD